jgi:hypothetical protein
MSILLQILCTIYFLPQIKIYMQLGCVNTHYPCKKLYCSMLSILADIWLCSAVTKVKFCNMFLKKFRVWEWTRVHSQYLLKAYSCILNWYSLKYGLKYVSILLLNRIIPHSVLGLITWAIQSYILPDTKTYKYIIVYRLVTIVSQGCTCWSLSLNLLHVPFLTWKILILENLCTGALNCLDMWCNEGEMFIAFLFSLEIWKWSQMSYNEWFRVAVTLYT